VGEEQCPANKISYHLILAKPFSSGAPSILSAIKGVDKALSATETEDTNRGPIKWDHLQDAAGGRGGGGEESRMRK